MALIYCMGSIKILTEEISNRVRDVESLQVINLGTTCMG